MERTNRNTIPQAAQQAIENYKNLRIGEQRTIRCPYYRNPRSGRERWGLNAYSGKGSPREIEGELRIIEKLEHATFEEMGDEKIRDIMGKRKLGIECSGFITHVLDAWTKAEKGKRIYQLLHFPAHGLMGKIVTSLRPFTHIDVETLVAPENAKEFSNINEMQAGDLIRFHTAIDPDVVLSDDIIDHAVLVKRVEREDGDVKRIYYVQSVKEKTGEGIKDGIITITNAGAPIEKQQWQEFPETGRTVLQGAKEAPRFYHLNFLD